MPQVVWTPQARAAHSAKIKAALRLKQALPSAARPPVTVKTHSVLAVLTRLLNLWKPRVRMLPSVWAEEHRILPLGTASRAGRWHNFVFQVDPLNIIADPNYASLTMCLASQVI